MLTRSFKFIERCFFHIWPVVLFTLTCFLFFEQAMQKRDLQFSKLTQQKLELLKEKEKALELQANLTLQVNSESDPAWIELKLMEKLGVSPEGYQKVFFSPVQSPP